MDEMEQKGIKVSTKEQILIREIRNETEDKAGAAQGYGLYDVNADYMPVFDADYLAECRKFYNRYFPDSGIAIGKLAGSAGKLAGTFLKMKDRLLNGSKTGTTDPGEILRKLDAFIDAHKYDEYENRNGEICMLGEQPGIYVAADDESIILEDLWLDFYEKTIQTPEVCRLMYIYRDITMIRKILKSTVRALWQTCLGGSIQGRGLALATLRTSEQSSVICIRNLYRTVMRESWLWLQRTTF